MNLKPINSLKAVVHCARVILLLAGLPQAASVQAGIPEPDLVWYGTVLMDSGGVPVRVTSGTLTWRVERVLGGAAWTISTPLTNINDQFSFVLRVPCETPEPAIPGSSNTVFLTSPPTGYRRATVTLDGQPLSFVSMPAPDQFAPTQIGRGKHERLDLVMGTLPEDLDGDGMADAWERQYFGGLNATPDGDADNDGVSNLREYRAGTNPLDPRSVFEFISINPVLGGMQIRWASQPNRHYRLRRSPTFSTNPAAFQVLQTGITATPPVNEFIDVNPTGSAHFFYLLELVD